MENDLLFLFIHLLESPLVCRKFWKSACLVKPYRVWIWPLHDWVNLDAKNSIFYGLAKRKSSSAANWGLRILNKEIVFESFRGRCIVFFWKYSLVGQLKYRIEPRVFWHLILEVSYCLWLDFDPKLVKYNMKIFPLIMVLQLVLLLSFS